MKRILLLFVPAIIGMVLASCTTPSGPSSPVEIWPMSIGKAWVFQITRYDSLGRVDNTELDSIVIIGDTMIGGQRWFRNYNGSSVATNLADGFYDLSPYDSLPRLNYKFPANVGDSYPLGENGMLATVTSTSREAHVPAGTFMTVEYEYGASYYREYIQLAPGFGPIRASLEEKIGNSYRPVLVEELLYTSFVSHPVAAPPAEGSVQRTANIGKSPMLRLFGR